MSCLLPEIEEYAHDELPGEFYTSSSADSPKALFEKPSILPLLFPTAPTERKYHTVWKTLSKIKKNVKNKVYRITFTGNYSRFGRTCAANTFSYL